MAGYHIPGDPYFAGPGLGTGGWIEESESEPEEEPQQAPESEPEEEPEEEPGQGPDEDEEEPMEDHDSDTDGGEHILDANSDSDEEIDIVESDEEDMGDGEVVNPTLPPFFLTPIPPRGTTGTYEVGQSSRPLPPFTAPATPLTGTVRALASRMTQLQREVQRDTRHLEDLDDVTRYATTRIRHLEEANETLQMEISARERVHDVRIQVLEEQVRAAEQRAAELQRQFDAWLRQQGSGSGPQ